MKRRLQGSHACMCLRCRLWRSERKNQHTFVAWYFSHWGAQAMFRCLGAHGSAPMQLPQRLLTPVIRELVGLGVDIEAVDDAGVTVLQRMAVWGSESEVQALLEAGADVQVKGVGGSTALMFASREGELGIVKCLLEAGADVQVKDDDGKTALMFASEEGHLGIVKCLLEAGADVQVKDDDGKTALMFASRGGEVGIVKCLLEAGADAHAADKHGQTVMMFGHICWQRAMYFGGSVDFYDQFIDMMIAAGVDPEDV
jgi:hypothetical protein